MEKKEKIAILLCCHERKEHTKACLDTLLSDFPDTLEPVVVVPSKAARGAYYPVKAK